MVNTKKNTVKIKWSPLLAPPLKVGISHEYFKIGLVACGPCFLFIFIFINVRKQLLTFKLRFWPELKGKQLNDS